MMNFKPSTIAFAAMMRVEEGLEEAILPLDMREAETLSLHGDFRLEPAEVEECLFVLENYTEKIIPYEEYESEIHRLTAANIARNANAEQALSPVGVTDGL